MQMTGRGGIGVVMSGGTKTLIDHKGGGLLCVRAAAPECSKEALFSPESHLLYSNFTCTDLYRSKNVK